jgi:glycosyltransferase involved in cell wall biosynthesis
VSDPIDRWPTVSVVIPVLNEEQHLRSSVEAILRQDYPGNFDVCLALGPSRDRTDDVAGELTQRFANVRTVANPTGATPAGLNAAIQATSGEVVVRVDGHAVLPDGYITRAVETLQRTGAVNVGGVQLSEGTTPFERAVALALSSPFGMGGARFHTGGAEGPVDTVYLGVFRRTAIEAVGLFDERLVRNQDYELNIRLREAGGMVWFDPQLAVSYRPRPNLTRLARQYFEYGAWKRSVLRLHPGSLRLRQVVPPIAIVAILVSLIASPWLPIALVVPGVYALAVAVASVVTGRRHGLGGVVRLLAIFPAMHMSWGAGFLLARPTVERERAE